ncbi:hypothetical protein FJZ26_05415, partial [Candidatus Parvarchaeota archaeon]|nr:hypothetical protein [Candidatus Parvarchaeota archaeon]
MKKDEKSAKGITMIIKSATVLANPKKKWAGLVKSQVESFLASRGIQVVQKNQDNGKVGNAQLAITVGGDGTILHNKAHYGKIIFGIGSKTSWICQARNTNWKSRLARFLSLCSKNKTAASNSDKLTSKRLVLQGRLNSKNLPIALNDIAVKTASHRIVDFSLRYGVKNGTRRARFFADGFIFSTPTGSGAYAYSAGGRELAFDARAYQLVAIAPYRRAFLPVVVRQSS